jgi:hypothetical protein
MMKKDKKETADVLNVVDDCSIWDGFTFDPGSYIRAVNLLRTHEKTSLLDGLRKYCEVNSGSSQWPSDSTKVFLLLRILFIPRDAGQQLPPIRIGMPLDTEMPSAQSFPLYPLALIADVPLLIVSGYMTGGTMEQPSSHIEFCARHCHLRPQALRPPDNPLPLAKTLVESAQWYRSERTPQDRSMLEAQLLRLVRSVYALPGSDEQSFSSFLERPGVWGACMNTFLHLDASWNPESNSYEFHGE